MINLASILGHVLTCDPRFAQQLQEELRTLGGNSRIETLSPGVLLIDRSEGNYSLAFDLQERTPFFLRHMFPISKTVANPSLENVVDTCETVIPNSLSNLKVGVQCRVLAKDTEYRAHDVKLEIDKIFSERGGNSEMRYPEYIVSILIAKQGYIGWSTPQQNLTRWSGGSVHYGVAENGLSRAQHKLEEAVEVLGVDLGSCQSALDLGAAPGGWTAFLLAKGVKVTAVDTGELDATLLKQSGLTFLRQNAFDLRFRPESFDLLTCDMSWNPLRTVHLLAELAPTLNRQGQLIFTVKFMGRSPLRTVRECIETLAGSFTFVRGRHLWHNREELTLYLERK